MGSKMQKDFKGFRKGCRYLVKDESKVWDIDLIEINILEISEKAIKIKFENGNTQWYLKGNYCFTLIENLSEVKNDFVDFTEEEDSPSFTLKLT
jgi:hypothetical protein